MFCTKCGAEIPDGSNFCVKCGIKVEDNPAPVPTKKSDKKYWIGVLGATLLISGFLTLSNTNVDFSSMGYATGVFAATMIKVAIPVGAVAFVIWLIKRKKK